MRANPSFHRTCAQNCASPMNSDGLDRPLSQLGNFRLGARLCKNSVDTCLLAGECRKAVRCQPKESAEGGAAEMRQ